MARTEPFDINLVEYEDWFEEHQNAYRSELKAVEAFIPKDFKGVEIGVGSGRFAAPLGIKYGVEPSQKMSEIARDRGIETKPGIAEDLPLENNTFDLALMVTTICFVDDAEASFKEAYRILKPGGRFVIGYIDKDSPLGQIYQKIKNQDKFYRMASFYNTDEVVKYLKKAGFKDIKFKQTIFKSPMEMDSVDPVKDGYGEGSFVVVKAVK